MEGDRSGIEPADVAVMKPSDARQSDDPGIYRRTTLDLATDRRVSKLCVDAIRIVVVNVVAEQAP